MLFINTLHKNKTVFKQSPFKSEIGQTEEKKGQFGLFFLNFTPFLPLFSFNIAPYLLFLASLPAHFSARGVQLHTETLPNGATQETRKGQPRKGLPIVFLENSITKLEIRQPPQKQKNQTARSA
nr:hypothetical protein [uncultured Prevotella sp.]